VSESSSKEHEEGWDLDPDRVVVRDKRRLDPETGEARHPAPAPDASTAPEVVAEPPAGAEPDKVAELTADLQRVSAEYANYRKRVDRDRVAVVEMATAGLLSGLLPVLDDIERAREHGDLTGPFAAVAASLEQLTAKLGLEQFGEAGEPFDPSVHEALMQAEPDATATVATCAAVLQRGYRLSGGRVLRPARVSVAEPGAAASAASDAE
jgi:molecular chaperone GrpE